ncbi:MAG: RdgB/HAM1 family non-canonical purine NTP pyrophosphatase [Verrucomicrobiia bacterium]|jgi:XTP/dITP diphosphohydrolase
MPTLIIATNNRHKVEEIKQILNQPDTAAFQILSARDLPEPPELLETGSTFRENAAMKAVQLAKYVCKMIKTGRMEISFPFFVIADDSGLEVDYLRGEPGVNSARFANPNGEQNSSDAENNSKLITLLRDVPESLRTARFRCVIAAVEVKASDFKSIEESSAEALLQPVYFEGLCEGRIGFEPQGDKGFGYDPLFYPGGSDRTFAEIGEEVKNKISHRARALEAFTQWVKERNQS